MKCWVNIGKGWKGQFVSHLSNALYNLIWSIKFWHQLLMAFSFERCLLIGMETKEHLIPFFKGTLWAMLIYLLLHAILSHSQIFLKWAENASWLWRILSTACTLEVPSKFEAIEGGCWPYRTSYGVILVASYKWYYAIIWQEETVVPTKATFLMQNISNRFWHFLTTYIYPYI